MSSGRVVYMNGIFVPEAEAQISIYDSALMFGDMVFEMTRSFNKKQFKLREHLERLYTGLKILRIPLKMSIEEMEGGTFTLTNGGIFGSMLSTPIINAPQSAILGMHNIVERPVVVNGKVVVRPIMYIALSYDHRIIDGKESVGFLVSIKESLENPKDNLLNGDVEASLFKKSKSPLSYRANYKHKL